MADLNEVKSFDQKRKRIDDPDAEPVPKISKGSMTDFNDKMADEAQATGAQNSSAHEAGTMEPDFCDGAEIALEPQQKESALLQGCDGELESTDTLNEDATAAADQPNVQSKPIGAQTEFDKGTVRGVLLFCAWQLQQAC